MYFWIHLAKDIDGLTQIVCTFIHREFFLSKKQLRTLLTIIDNLARLFQTIDMVRAEREESGFYGLRIRRSSGIQALDGMEDRGGIIHHAIGIHRRTELFFLKASSDLRSKA